MLLLYVSFLHHVDNLKKLFNINGEMIILQMPGWGVTGSFRVVGVL